MGSTWNVPQAVTIVVKDTQGGTNYIAIDEKGRRPKARAYVLQPRHGVGGFGAPNTNRSICWTRWSLIQALRDPALNVSAGLPLLPCEARRSGSSHPSQASQLEQMRG